MEHLRPIKTAIERTQKALRLKPHLGQETKISTVRIADGLRCEISEGNWQLATDMPEAVGGKSSAPTPGVYGRAALGSCLAIGYMMKAAELQVPINSLQVQIEADFDDGALLGTSPPDVRPGYLALRYHITVVSDAPQEDLLKVLDEGDSHSPYLDIFSNPLSCTRSLTLIPKTPAL